MKTVTKKESVEIRPAKESVEIRPAITSKGEACYVIGDSIVKDVDGKRVEYVNITLNKRSKEYKAVEKSKITFLTELDTKEQVAHLNNISVGTHVSIIGNKEHFVVLYIGVDKNPLITVVPLPDKEQSKPINIFLESITAYSNPVENNFKDTHFDSQVNYYRQLLATIRNSIINHQFHNYPTLSSYQTSLAQLYSTVRNLKDFQGKTNMLQEISDINTQVHSLLGDIARNEHMSLYYGNVPNQFRPYYNGHMASFLHSQYPQMPSYCDPSQLYNGNPAQYPHSIPQQYQQHGSYSTPQQHSSYVPQQSYHSSNVDMGIKESEVGVNDENKMYEILADADAMKHVIDTLRLAIANVDTPVPEDVKQQLKESLETLLEAVVVTFDGKETFLSLEPNSNLKEGKKYEPKTKK